jgi:membrane fusion protein (multidrug efflux system)
LMKTRLILSLFLVQVFLATEGAYLSLTYGQSRKEEPSGISDHGAPSLILTSQPVSRDFVLLASWIGEVRSQVLVKLVALDAGRVEAIEAGDEAPIEAGAPILTLGGDRVEIELKRLQAQIDSLESQIALADRTLARLRENRKARISTQDEVAAAEEAEFKLQIQMKGARLALDSFKSRLLISAPIFGIFTNRLVSTGQTVNPGDTLGEIVDIHHLRIVASLFPPAGVQLEGKEARVRINDTHTLSGSVSKVLPRAGSTGAVLIWIEGKEIDEQLRPGETVSGDLILETRTGATAVPESALVYGPEEQPYVFLLEKGSYLKRPVQPGLIQNGWAQILSGIEMGQSVVTEGAYELFYRDFNRMFKAED